MFGDELRKAPFLRLLIPLSGGILGGRYLSAAEGFPLHLPDWILPAAGVLLILASLGNARTARALLLPAFLLGGMVLGKDTPVEAVAGEMFSGRICADPVPVGRGTRILIDRIRCRKGEAWIRVEGRASLYLAGSPQTGRHLDPGGLPAGSDILQPGTRILAEGGLAPYDPPLNPHEFDYAGFQRGRGILYRAYLDSTRWITIVGDAVGSPEHRSLRIRSLGMRRKLMKQLDRRIGGRDQRAILHALLLGYREEMDPELRQDFARSGTVHILAVSGLHVGILYFLPALLLRRLRYHAVAGIAAGAIVFSALWMYAFLTGLSPPVVRAVCMCCIHGMAMITGRKVSTLHVASLAGFLMILARPAVLFEAGFQLSFAAVTAIILLYPRFMKMFRCQGRAGHRIASLISVSLAAQLGTMPLCAFYFHRISPASVPASLLVVPLATAILYAGFAYFVFSGMETIASPLATLLERMACLLEWFTRGVGGLPGSHIEGISLLPCQVLLVYICGAFILLFLERRTARHLLLLGLSILLCGTVSVVREVRSRTHRNGYVFALRGETAIALVNGRQATLFRGFGPSNFQSFDDPCPPGTIAIDELPREIRPFLWRYRLDPSPFPLRQHIRSPGMEAIYTGSKGQRMLILGMWDENRCRGMPPFEADILVLCGNPRINVSRICDRFGISCIVADGSNHPFHVREIESACSAEGIRFHSTRRDGCFVY